MNSVFVRLPASPKQDGNKRRNDGRQKKGWDRQKIVTKTKGIVALPYFALEKNSKKGGSSCPCSLENFMNDVVMRCSTEYYSLSHISVQLRALQCSGF